MKQREMVCKKSLTGLSIVPPWTVEGFNRFYRNGADGVISTGTGGQLAMVSVLFFLTFSDSLTVE